MYLPIGIFGLISVVCWFYAGYLPKFRGSMRRARKLDCLATAITTGLIALAFICHLPWAENIYVGIIWAVVSSACWFVGKGLSLLRS